MRPLVYILLVEDDTDQIGSWQAEIREFNKDETRPFCLDLKVAETYEQAISAITASQLDAAIVDVRIPKGGVGSGQSADNGNKTVDDLLDAVSGPIAIFSAHPGEIDEAIRTTPVKIFVKEAGQEKAILGWMCDHAALMTAIRQATGDIRREAARVFAGAIWPHWNETRKRRLAPELLRQIFTRQIVAHLTEQLSLPLTDLPAYQASECYFAPPLRKARLHTGDLLEFDRNVYVILTPQCDIVRQYPERILLGKCRLIDDWATTKDKDKEKYATQNIGLKKHFLPPAGREVRG